MRLTLLFGGLSRERLVAVATTQSLHKALPEADLWFWDEDNHVYEASSLALLGHQRPFEVPFRADGHDLGTIDQALDRAAAEDRVLVLGLHGGIAENGEFQVKCEARGVPFTGSGSAASHLSFDKVSAKRFAACAGVPSPAGIALSDLDAAFAEYGKLVAKPAQDGSSFGLIFVNSTNDLVAVREAANEQPYLIEPFVTGAEATCAVLEQADGSLIALPPIEIIPDRGAFDYHSKYLSNQTQEICPARFAPEVMAEIQRLAIAAHKALSCRGYTRSDFIVSDKGPVFIETNTLPGMTASSLYPKALAAQGIGFVDFLHGQVDIAVRRAGK
ncbi:D-alanine--D-alanine ligase family protein [Asticcacaulis excentricus]|uniref:D-alanine--D-alanine ligase n=1 Tax=Asticcacaulis excentricus TaxID=78587 RepID=A0A3G9FYU2_9CAUL|nr:ATP-grasp domain-containing protein [Asticcacaulis excentricus]BBF79557.1 D-alanine--D-alanine ligase [Asticcacaulis excentricus]